MWNAGLCQDFGSWPSCVQKILESASVRLHASVRMDVSWSQYPTDETTILDWINDYQEGRYDWIGLIDMLPDATRYSWAPEDGWPPRSEYWIAVLRRVDGDSGRDPAER